MSTTTETRSRRKIEVKAPEIPQPLQELARTAYRHNAQQNASKSAYEKDRKSLYAGMKEAKVTTFETKGLNLKNEEVTLIAEIGTPTGQVVDVRALQKAVTAEQFMDILQRSGISQAAITEVVGTAVVNQVVRPALGTENVKVSVKK